MSDPPPDPDADSGADLGSTARTPLWVEVFGIVFAVVILLVVILLLAGGGHGPARHTRSSGPGGQPSFEIVTQANVHAFAQLGPGSEAPAGGRK